MTTFVLYSVYNERNNLPRAIDSAERCFPESIHVVVDGKYPDFDGESDSSTDGTREYAELRGLLVDCIDHECEKRTAGLAFIDGLAQDGDWVLVLDADEELTSRFAWPRRVGSFSFSRATRPEVSYGRCRLYRWEPGLHFAERHYDLFDIHGELVASLEDAPDFQVVGMGIHHNDSHDETRHKAKQDYYRRLREREGHPAAARSR